MQKDHLEIILEDIREKFDLVLEGHAALGGKIDAVAEDLRAHRRDTEAHPAFRCVPWENKIG